MRIAALIALVGAAPLTGWNAATAGPLACDSLAQPIFATQPQRPS
jgi:hypothetical protein